MRLQLQLTRSFLHHGGIIIINKDSCRVKTPAQGGFRVLIFSKVGKGLAEQLTGSAPV